MKILEVMNVAGRPLAEFEFNSIMIHGVNGRFYVGCSESTLGRRLREMRESGMLTSKKRDGKQFMEYALPVPVEAQEPACPV